MSLFGSGKAINEGILQCDRSLRSPCISLFTAGLKVGEITAFSMLYLSVMAPLNEVHRFIDEGHESSLRVGDLLGLLTEPVDASFRVKGEAKPQLILGEPLYVANDLRVDFRGTGRVSRRALDGLSITIRHGETIGVAGPSGGGKTTWLRTMMRLSHPSGGEATLGGVPLEKRFAAGHRGTGWLRGSESVCVRWDDCSKYCLWFARG